jgi:hypothetical protein
LNHRASGLISPKKSSILPKSSYLPWKRWTYSKLWTRLVLCRFVIKWHDMKHFWTTTPMNWRRSMVLASINRVSSKACSSNNNSKLIISQVWVVNRLTTALKMS